MKRILIIDDHAILRKGLKETLEEELGHASFGEAENAIQALHQVRGSAWDLILLDIGLEGRSGLDVLEEIKGFCPETPVLILSMYPENEFGIRCLRLGAAGYINKQSAPEQLVQAVSQALAGGRYITPALAELLAVEMLRESQKLPHETLSNRELEVLRLIAQGRSLKAIADSLNLSIKTVGTYHTRLMEKMGMTSDVQLTRYALQKKLVD
jgi:DNA-binding NarL/FixJ family response regulator